MALVRARYAYADTLLDVGRTAEARGWFERVCAADVDAVTDATERLLALDGVLFEEIEQDLDDEPTPPDAD